MVGAGADVFCDRCSSARDIDIHDTHRCCLVLGASALRKGAAVKDCRVGTDHGDLLVCSSGTDRSTVRQQRKSCLSQDGSKFSRTRVSTPLAAVVFRRWIPPHLYLAGTASAFVEWQGAVV